MPAWACFLRDLFFVVRQVLFTEDMAADPIGTLETALNFLGLDLLDPDAKEVCRCRMLCIVERPERFSSLFCWRFCFCSCFLLYPYLAFRAAHGLKVHTHTPLPPPPPSTTHTLEYYRAWNTTLTPAVRRFIGPERKTTVGRV